MSSAEFEPSSLQWKRRIIGSVVCLLTVALCLLYARYRQQLPTWWRENGGGIPYVVFWATLWYVVFPRRDCILPICIGVTAFTSVLECLQLWKPDWLVQIRGTRFGAALLGSGFTWADFPPYLIGGFVAAIVLWLQTPRISKNDVSY